MRNPSALMIDGVIGLRPLRMLFSLGLSRPVFLPRPLGCRLAVPQIGAGKAHTRVQRCECVLAGVVGVLPRAILILFRKPAGGVERDCRYELPRRVFVAVAKDQPRPNLCFCRVSLATQFNRPFLQKLQGKFGAVQGDIEFIKFRPSHGGPHCCDLGQIPP
jgi:hypothetical protein